MSLEKEILSKFSLLFVMNGLGKLFILITNILLARYLSVNSYGEFIYVLSFITMLTFITKFGFDQAVLKFLPEYEVKKEENKIKSFNTFIILFASVISLMVILVITINPIFFAKYVLGNVIYVKVLTAQVYILLFLTLINILASIFQARKDIKTFSVSLNLYQNGLFLLFVALICIYDVVNIEIVIYLKYLSLVITIIYLIYKIIKSKWLGSIYNIPRKEYTSIVKFSVPMMLVGVIGIMTIQISVYLTGYFHTSRSVAILNSASQIAIVVSFMLQAINQVFAPYISKMYFKGDLKQLNNTYSKICYVMTFVSLIFLTFLITFKLEIMNIFGSEFIVGANAMIIIALGQVYNAITGPCEYMLTMTGYHKANLVINIFTLITAIVCGIILIPLFGFLGGALCTTISLVFSNTIRVYIMYKRLKIIPFKISLLN